MPKFPATSSTSMSILETGCMLGRCWAFWKFRNSTHNSVVRSKALHLALQADYDRLAKAAKAQPGLIAEQELDDAQSKAEASQSQIDESEAALSASRQGADTA